MLSLFVREIYIARQALSSSSHFYYQALVQRSMLSAFLSQMVVFTTMTLLAISQTSRKPELLSTNNLWMICHSVLCCLAVWICFGCESLSKKRCKRDAKPTLSIDLSDRETKQEGNGESPWLEGTTTRIRKSRGARAARYGLKQALMQTALEQYLAFLVACVTKKIRAGD
eukprot:g52092.t1